jgi:hypothetical protein
LSRKRGHPRRLTTLWAFTACYRDSFTFLKIEKTKERVEKSERKAEEEQKNRKAKQKREEIRYEEGEK